MSLRILDPRFLTIATALLFGAAALHADPGAPTPTPPTKKSTPEGPSAKTDGARKTKNIPASLARVTHHSRNFRGWSKYCWFPRYQCYGYFNASQRMWFYYYEPFARFLPVRYLTMYPPTTVGIGPVTTRLPLRVPATGAPPLPCRPARDHPRDSRLSFRCPPRLPRRRPRRRMTSTFALRAAVP